MYRIAMVIAMFSTFSCSTKTTELENSAIADSLIESIEDSADFESPQFLLWEVDDLNQSKKRNPDYKPGWIQTDTVVNCINRVYPGPGIFIQKKSGDTVYLGIKQPTYLSEQMGSSGAASFIAELVINLTSVPDVRYVKLEMPQGSHAGPDTWSREDFFKYKELKE